jgi:hypothetical protein
MRQLLPERTPPTEAARLRGCSARHEDPHGCRPTRKASWRNRARCKCYLSRNDGFSEVNHVCVTRSRLISICVKGMKRGASHWPWYAEVKALGLTVHKASTSHAKTSSLHRSQFVWGWLGLHAQFVPNAATEFHSSMPSAPGIG